MQHNYSLCSYNIGQWVCNDYGMQNISIGVGVVYVTDRENRVVSDREARTSSRAVAKTAKTTRRIHTRVLCG